MALGTRLALDTNAYSALQQGAKTALNKLISTASSVALPLTVVAELRAGFAYGNQEPDNLAKLEGFMASPRASVLYPDDQTASLYAKIWSDLRRKGRPIPTNDIWIAALCIQNDYALSTNDSDFEYVALLRTALI